MNKDANWRNQTASLENDLTKLENCLAVFDIKKNEICKLSSIDMRGERFDVSSQKITKWISFNNGILFNFSDHYEFEKYYELYKNNFEGRVLSPEKLFSWLKLSQCRIEIMKES